MELAYIIRNIGHLGRSVSVILSVSLYLEGVLDRKTGIIVTS